MKETISKMKRQPSEWTGWISLQSKGLSRVFSNTTIQNHQFFGAQLSLCPPLTSIHVYWKNHSFDYMDLCWKSHVSAFEYTAQICHSFPSKKQMFFNFMAAVTIHSDFGAQENKVCHCFIISPFICCKVLGLGAMIFVLNAEF